MIMAVCGDGTGEIRSDSSFIFYILVTYLNINAHYIIIMFRYVNIIIIAIYLFNIHDDFVCICAVHIKK